MIGSYPVIQAYVARSHLPRLPGHRSRKTWDIQRRPKVRIIIICRRFTEGVVCSLLFVLTFSCGQKKVNTHQMTNIPHFAIPIQQHEFPPNALAPSAQDDRDLDLLSSESEADISGVLIGLHLRIASTSLTRSPRHVPRCK